jgi:hypothetical protein
MGNAATRKLVSILIVAGCIALGIGAVIAIKYAQQHRAQAVAVQAMPAPEVVAPQPPPSVPSPTPPSEPTPSPAVTPEPVKQAQPGVPTPVPEVKNEPAPEPVKSPEPAKPAVDVNALLARGQALFEQGQPEAALKPLEAAAAAAPDNAGVQVVLALARLDAGKTAAAQTAALRAVELAPQNARAHLALGSVLQALEQPAKARAEFETYLRLAPTGKDAADVRAILSSLK